jgi:hypothetical protein
VCWVDEEAARLIALKLFLFKIDRLRVRIRLGPLLVMGAKKAKGSNEDHSELCSFHFAEARARVEMSPT